MAFSPLGRPQHVIFGSELLLSNSTVNRNAMLRFAPRGASADDALQWPHRPANWTGWVPKTPGKCVGAVSPALRAHGTSCPSLVPVQSQRREFQYLPLHYRLKDRHVAIYRLKDRHVAISTRWFVTPSTTASSARGLRKICLNVLKLLEHGGSACVL